MRKDTFVLAITGPTGSGKSTVAEMLAKQIDRCVNIDADLIKHMIVSGFYKDDKNPGSWGFSEWGLVGDSIGLLAANFLKEGYKVVINGYLDEPAWTNIQKHIPLTYKVLLLPHLDTVIRRDSERNEEAQMGKEAVNEHHIHFSSSSFFNDFTKIDTSSHTVDQTVEEVMKIVKVTSK